MEFSNENLPSSLNWEQFLRIKKIFIKFGIFSLNTVLSHSSTLVLYVYVNEEKKNLYFASCFDADYADDIAILANAPAQAEIRLHGLERVTAGIGLHLNAHKTECMCYNQIGDISPLNGSSLKLVDKFTYQGSSVSSTETDIDTRLTKAWAAINRLSVIWKSDLTDKMKRSFFQSAVVSILLYGCTTSTLTKQLEKKTWR